MRLIKFYHLFSIIFFLLLNVLVCKAETYKDSLSPTASEIDSISFFPSIVNFSIDSSYGPKINDKAINLKLLSLNKDTFSLYSELDKSKPILLISGSYTCPAFRNRIPNINKIYKEFSEHLNIYIVYTLEAHPSDVSSIYFGKIKIGKRNNLENILYPQAKTYKERCNTANIMKDSISILPPILIDNKNNDFIKQYGTSPTTSYLIDTNGTIIYKELFNKSKPQLYQKLTDLYPIEKVN